MTLLKAADVVKRCQALEKTVGEEAQRKRLAEVATAVKPVATAAAAQDLGPDAAFSGWRNGTIPLRVRFTMHTSGAAVTVHRDGRSAGPWRVAESGRNQGGAGGAFHGPGISSDGSTRRNKNGSLGRVRARKSKRWTGTTAGKGTWGKAVTAMDAKARPLMLKLHKQAIGDAFLRGKA